MSPGVRGVPEKTASDWLNAALGAVGRRPRLGGIDHIEFWVGNARASAAFFAGCYGFEIVAYAGPETGVTDRVSYVLAQGDIRFVVTAGIVPSSPIVAHVAAHGDGVRDVAFVVENAAAAYGAATARGATGVEAPHVVADASGRIVRASVATYGETRHTFVEREDYRGLFAPGYEAPPVRRAGGPARRAPAASTTWWPTWSSATSSSGSTSTPGSSASTRWSTSTTTRSPPSTRR